MKKISTSKLLLILFVFFILISCLAFVLVKKNNIKNVPPLTSPQLSAPAALSFRSILPGESLEEDVLKILGAPESRVVNNGQTSYFYKNPNNINDKHEVVTQNKEVVFVREIITLKDDKKTQDIMSSIKETPTQLFGEGSDFGASLWVFPKSGIALLSLGQAKTLLEVWYFPPTTLEAFLKSWGKDYSKNLQDEGF